MENKLPLYKIKVNPNDDSGVYMVSLVDEPAIEENWIKLSKQVEIKFSANKDKQLLYGPMLIPNKMIYRRDDNGYEYNIMFDEETIELIAEKFKKNKYNDQFNFEHSDRTVKAFLKEDWIIENPDKSNKYGFDLPNGTWFGAVKVEDEEFWNTYVKGEEVKGFSVEIMAGAELVELSINNKLNKKEKMEKTELANVMKTDGVPVYYEGDFVVGAQVFLDEEMTQPAPDGEHELEGGIKIIVEEGKVSEIIEIEEEMSEELETEEVTEELETEEVVEETTEELSFEEQVMSIVQPLIDGLITQNSELMNKLTEMEAKLTENKDEELNETLSKVKDLEDKIEVLSKMAGTETIDKKSDDRKVKIEEEISSKINIFRKFR